MAEAFEAASVQDNQSKVRAIFELRKADGDIGCTVKPCEDEHAPPPAGWKRVSFIRHGEGHHNVAQREWKEAGKPGEPYTLETDPDFKYIDPELTECGREQARGLKERGAALDLEVIFVSPMRRATQTALIGLEAAVEAKVPVVAHECLHEMAGKHTCDKRQSMADLKAEFPQVDYDQLVCEEDPYWLDGLTRESWESVVKRGAAFVNWMLERPEQRIAVAAHSAILLSIFNAVLDVEQPAARDWFATGEMRTVLLGPAAEETNGAVAEDKADGEAGKEEAVEEAAGGEEADEAMEEAGDDAQEAEEEEVSPAAAKKSATLKKKPAAAKKAPVLKKPAAKPAAAPTLKRPAAAVSKPAAKPVMKKPARK